MKLWDRTYTLTVGDHEYSNLAFSFEVKKTLKPEPNSCTIKVLNMSPESRARLEKSKQIVRLEAGYGGENAQIYLGETRAAWTTVAGPDRVTELTTGDGEKAIQSARINVSIGRGSSPEVALRAMVKALGVPAGNVEHAVTVLKTKGKIAGLFASGTVISGNVASELTDFCKSADLEWSIQDSKLQILDKGKALDGKAILLSSDTGLLDSPSVDSKGIVTANCLLIPEIRPGVKVQFESLSFSGAGYLVQECTYRGDTWGDSWGIELTCKKY